MTFLQAVILGTVSGLTVFLGMPVARLRALAKEHVSFLNSIAIGVLFFLFVDVVEHAVEPIEAAIAGSDAGFASLIAILIAGFTVGFIGLVYYARFLHDEEGGVSARDLALLIAIGIGLHNFSEGLAIGNAAQSGELKFALLLIVGFGLHNITEAFGIAAPLAGQAVGWRFLSLAALIAGGPNFLGTAIGYQLSSAPLSLLFLALAAGAIAYVIGELFAAGRKLSAHMWSGWGIVLGFFAGLLTDFILIALGA